MIRSTTLPILALFALATQAQPVLTFADNAPMPGQTFTLRYGPYVAEGTAGADQTWDMSSLITDSMDVIMRVDPGTTPNGSTFPTATVAETGADAIMYFRSAADGMYLAGSDAAGLLIPYSDEARYLPFPCAYTDTWNDAASATFQVETFEVNRSCTITGEADGYGTLVMPTWSASDVLRVHWVEETDDAMDLFTLHTVYESYLYFVVGQHYPILQLVHTEATILGQTTISEHAQWVDELSTGMAATPASANGLVVFPVPAREQLNVILPAEMQSGRITIADMQGRIVGTSDLKIARSGQIDISALPAGVYVLSATSTEGTIATKRFVVE